MKMSSVTRPSLLQGLRDGDSFSWERLIDLYGPMVYSICRRSGLGHEAAADVMQDTLLSVSRSLGDFQYRKASDTFRGWLCRITQRRILDYQRRRAEALSGVGGSVALAALQQHPDPLKEDESETDLDPSVQRGVVQRAADLVRTEVELRTWKAFWMTAIEGQTATEAAVELGMTPAAVRKSKSRVGRRLREVLGDDSVTP